MNVDRCHPERPEGPVIDQRHPHVPTSPGQSVCTCLDYIMWLRFVVEVQAEIIADLVKQMRLPEDVRFVRQQTGHTTACPP